MPEEGSIPAEAGRFFIQKDRKSYKLRSLSGVEVKHLHMRIIQGLEEVKRLPLRPVRKQYIKRKDDIFGPLEGLVFLAVLTFGVWLGTSGIEMYKSSKKSKMVMLNVNKLNRENSLDDRRRAAEALYEASDKTTRGILVQHLKDADHDIRFYAARALIKVGDKTTVKPLIEALTDSDKYVRRKAALALGRIRDLRAVKPLIELLRDGDYGTRRDAASALGDLGDAQALIYIKGALKDEPSPLAASAMKDAIWMIEKNQRAVTTPYPQRRGTEDPDVPST